MASGASTRLRISMLRYSKNWGMPMTNRLLTALAAAVLLANTSGAIADSILFGGIGGHNISAGPEASANDGALAIIDQNTATITIIGHPANVARISGLTLTPRALSSRRLSRRAVFRHLPDQAEPVTCSASIRPPARSSQAFRSPPMALRSTSPISPNNPEQIPCLASVVRMTGAAARAIFTSSTE
jgi:hypothetical protein